MSWKCLDLSMRDSSCPPFLRNNPLELVWNYVDFTRQYTLLTDQTHVQIQLVYNAVLILHAARPWATWYPNFIAKACILYIPNLLYTNNMKPKTPRVSVPFVYTTKGAFQKRLRSRKCFSSKFSFINKLLISQCMGKIFCVEFQRDPFTCRTKYPTHTLKGRF